MLLERKEFYACDVTKDDKLLDALILLLCSYFLYNFDYSLKNVMVDLENIILGINTSKMPVSVTQAFSAQYRNSADHVFCLQGSVGQKP